MRRPRSICAVLVLLTACSASAAPDKCDFGFGCGPDRTPPVMTWVTPVKDTDVVGTIQLAVNATDDRGLLGVAFLVNGVTPIGPPAFITSPPYATSWNSADYADGDTVSLVAIALDRSGNADTVIRREVPAN